MRVESDRYPYLPVSLSLQGRKTELEALLDTGCDAGLAVSASTVAYGRSLKWSIAFELADGSRVDAPAYLATVQVGSLPPVTTIVIALGNEPILGRAVADQFKITLDHGQRVIVEP